MVHSVRYLGSTLPMLPSSGKTWTTFMPLFFPETQKIKIEFRGTACIAWAVSTRGGGIPLDTIKEKCNRVLNVPAKLSIFYFASFSCSSIEELTQYLTWVLNFSIGLNNVFNIPKFSFCNNYCIKVMRKTLSNQPISILETILTLFLLFQSGGMHVHMYM